MDLSNDAVIHIKKDGIEYLQFRRLLQYKGLVHAYTLKPIDIKGKSKDDKNYVKICHALGLDNNNVVMPIQTHTKNVEIAFEDSQSTDFQDVDGLITSVKNKVYLHVLRTVIHFFYMIRKRMLLEIFILDGEVQLLKLVRLRFKR